jgi:hypothetical protein
MKLHWVFDVISPFSYLAVKQLPQLPANVDLTLVPVLFAGLLNHHGQVGNAEIESKRRFTYRFALWRARKMGVPMRIPPAHPFNPLHALRLVIAAGSTHRAAETALDFVFQHGRDVTNPDVLADLARARHRRCSRGARRPANQTATARQHRLGDRAGRVRCPHIRDRRRAVLGARRVRDGPRLPSRPGTVCGRRDAAHRSLARRSRAPAADLVGLGFHVDSLASTVCAKLRNGNYI